MAASDNEGFQIAGIGTGGLLVIGGILLVLLTSLNTLGIILAIVGLVFFGGFAKGKWY